MQSPKNLAQLKRYYMEGGRSTVVRCFMPHINGEETPMHHRYMGITRNPKNASSYKVLLVDPGNPDCHSHLEYGRAADWAFKPEEHLAIFYGGWGVTVYRLDDAA